MPCHVCLAGTGPTHPYHGCIHPTSKAKVGRPIAQSKQVSSAISQKSLLENARGYVGLELDEHRHLGSEPLVRFLQCISDAIDATLQILGPIRPDVPLGSQQDLALQDTWTRSSVLPPNQDVAGYPIILRVLKSIPRNFLGFLLDEELGLRSDPNGLPSWIDPLLQPSHKDSDQLNNYFNAIMAWVLVLPRGSKADGAASGSETLTVKDAETPAQGAVRGSDNEGSDIPADWDPSSSDSSEHLSGDDSLYSPEDASEASSDESSGPANPSHVSERPSRRGADLARERIRVWTSVLNAEHELLPKGPKPLNKHQKPRLKGVHQFLQGHISDDKVDLLMRSTLNEFCSRA